MRDLIAELKKQEAWIKKAGVKKVEFSNLLDIFRDERELIAAALDEIERLEALKANNPSWSMYEIKALRLTKTEAKLAKAKEALQLIDDTDENCSHYAMAQVALKEF